ncbi:IucA/IucC family protein [Undibacterium griseum]|uniref:Siderophore biosynthesis protein n=1 Tax=Undibacterium griseum TaxID=2762295 RepID=A0ABR6YN48_9BURK|nr:IucA/IucC family protein [Undibacterium griseum]MBC3885220.1 siderophore biosynthesis protein [Undibacterium griseum]
MNHRTSEEHLQPDLDAVYVCTRVIDALLREDVRACVTRARLISSEDLPVRETGFPLAQRWLEISHFGTGRIWIPVSPEKFMQSWRLTRLPLLAEDGGQVQSLFQVEDILTHFSVGADDDTCARFTDFKKECITAVGHRRAAQIAQRDWFAAGTENTLHHWHEHMLHHDRLASYLDHPLYPTARAKLGFEIDHLRSYAPEFSCRFKLNWLAVPRTLHQSSGNRLPPGWPCFTDVGLPETLAEDHALVPVHPFVWNGELNTLLTGANLQEKVIRAPHTYMSVTPTLSVRSLVLNDNPAWHLKLPLTIRTLGAKNIRTIKPSTIRDGQRVQNLLAAIAEREPAIRGRLLLTAEDTGAHVDGKTFLGYIVRHYPDAALQHSTPVPVAGLLASTPLGGCVAEELAARFYDGDTVAFFDDYLELTLRLHLTLWVRYGIALESNQQNSVLVLSEQAPRMRLMLKDNDAARLHRTRLEETFPTLATHIDSLEDARLIVDHELPLAQMFTTITLQLNLAVPTEGLAEQVAGFSRTRTYVRLRERTAAILNELAAEGENVTLARQTLLDDDWLYIKYLLTAATLLDKGTTGAADVNKFYGRSAPNFLKVSS